MRRVDGRGVLEAQGWPARMKAGGVGNEELLEGLGCGSTVAFQRREKADGDGQEWSRLGHDREGDVGAKEGGKEE